MPFTLILPPSRYATARGKQYACENEPRIYRITAPSVSWHHAIYEIHLKYLDLVPKDLRWRPVHHRLVLIHAVDHNRAAAPHVVDALLCDLLHTRRLHDNVKPIRIVLPQLLPLRVRVLPVELDVLVTRIQLLRDVHLDALVRRDDDLVRAVELEQLRENQPCGSGPEEEHVNADRRVELVQPVDRASCGLEERRLFVGEIVNLVALILWAAQEKSLAVAR